MPMTDEHYDLVVIGSGPAGQKAAIKAAKLVNKLYDLNESHATAGELMSGFPEVLIRRG
jgi:pyruvate/2-oxoglutarate dehydrogenase complex dihydrolipoamide dehydrogenase (E3) component